MVDASSIHRMLVPKFEKKRGKKRPSSILRRARLVFRRTAARRKIGGEIPPCSSSFREGRSFAPFCRGKRREKGWPLTGMPMSTLRTRRIRRYRPWIQQQTKTAGLLDPGPDSKREQV